MRGVAPDRLPRSLVSLYQSLSFDAAYPEAWYAASTMPDMKRIMVNAYEYHSALVDEMRSMDEALASQEADSTPRLLCNWRAKGKFPFVYTNGDELTFTNPRQAAALTHELRHIGAEVRAAIRTASDETVNAYRDAVFPINKGKSAPFWIPGSSPGGAVALVRLVQGVKSLKELKQRCFNAGATLPPVITLYTRVQGASRPRTVYELDETGRPIATNAEALLAKVRKVQAVPFVYNYMYGRVGAVLLSACRMESTFGGTALVLPPMEQALAFIRRESGGRPDLCLAEDLSGYDDSVAAQTISLFDKEIFEGALTELRHLGLMSKAETSLLTELERSLLGVPILTPPMVRSPAVGAMMMPRKGGIVSGHRLTSVIGSLINLARIRAIARRLDIKVKACVFGDDTVVIFDSTVARSRYESALQSQKTETGFETKVAPDVSFLMKRAFGGYGYLGRMLMTSLQREVSSEPTNAYMAALGLSARRMVLRGHPYAERFDAFFTRETTCGPPLREAWMVAEQHGFDPAALASHMSLESSTSVDRLEKLIEPFVRAGLSRQLNLGWAEDLVETTAYAKMSVLESSAKAMTLPEAERAVRAASPLFR